MKTFGYIISIFLVSGLNQVFAQSDEQIRDWKPSMVFLSSDIVGLTKIATPGNFQTEFQAKIDFDRFFLAFDYGFSKKELMEPHFNYDSQGSFYRIGPQVNFMQFNKNRSNLYFGLMLAGATVQDDISYAKTDEFWNDSDHELSNRDIKARWLEANAGLSVRLVGPLFIGYTVRFKLAKTMSNIGVLQPYEIPGFGLAEKKSNFGFNYYITYRFGFRNKPVPMRPQKNKRLENVDNSENDVE